MCCHRAQGNCQANEKRQIIITTKLNEKDHLYKRGAQGRNVKTTERAQEWSGGETYCHHRN